jgi:lipoprotein LprA
MSRRSLVGGVALATVAAGLQIGFAGARAGAADDAKSILEHAVKAMAKVKSFHFKLTTEGGTTTVMEGFELNALEGDVVRPDSFQAKATVKVAIISLDVHIIGIGEHVWVTDPRSATGSYIEITGQSGETGNPLTITDLLNPDRLLLQAVDLIQEPKVDGTEKIDDVETTRIKGIFDPTKTGIATPTTDVLTLHPMPVEIWIDGDGLVRRMRLDGPLTTAEAGSIKRILELTKFDEKVEIKAPAGS